MNKSPDKKTRPSAAYDPELRQKLQHVKTEDHQLTAARVSVQKKESHFDQMEQEELLKKTKRELEHWETPDDTPSPMNFDKVSHAMNIEMPDFDSLKAKVDEFKPPVITEQLRDIKIESDKDAMIRVRYFGLPQPDLQWFHNGEDLRVTDRVYWKFVDKKT